ncbi:hypothetical protein POTOM_033417 [Populus tomentosa]|uniref:Uncharacterized protein n=1 Tax=Populus tomentosa TaxID=118781 RepID=A0A8X8CQN3_POPTO|nr:hypothetical protein POTOM_033417 [Populus tomentosa]
MQAYLFRYFEMESFSTIFNAKKSTLCIRDAEIKITSGKCVIRGQAVVVPEECRSGISIRSFSDGNGAKCTEFIVPKDVSVDEEVPATPNVAVAVAPSYPLLAGPQASNSSSKETPRKPHKKKRKQASLL